MQAFEIIKVRRSFMSEVLEANISLELPKPVRAFIRYIFMSLLQHGELDVHDAMEAVQQVSKHANAILSMPCA